MTSPPRLFDRTRHRRRLDRAARGYSTASFLKDRAAQDLTERLEAIMRDFPVAVDLGARDGAFARALAQSPARARIGLLVETDLSPAMLAGRRGPRIAADEEALPFAPQSIDLFVSSLALHWTNDLPGVLAQIGRALRPDGLFLATIFGGETLSELRRALIAAEAELEGGAALRVAPMAQPYDAAGLLQRAGLALPVTDVETVVVRYDHPLKLMADLRAMGETAVLAGPVRPLTRQTLGRAMEIYTERFAGPDGRIEASFDLITLTGWAPHDSQQKPLRPGEGKVRLEDALAAVKRTRE